MYLQLIETEEYKYYIQEESRDKKKEIKKNQQGSASLRYNSYFATK